MLLTQASANPGITYTYNDLPITQNSRVTGIYVPGGTDPIRGFLFNGNGAGGNSSSEANDRHKQAWADKHRFAIVATGFFGNFYNGVAGNDWRVFEAALADAATRSGHPELVNAPFVGWGFSNGGQMTYGLARLLPDRAIAFITNKGGFYQTTIGSDPLGVPAIWIAGQLDNTNNRRSTIESLYKAGRAAGAPWAWLEERNMGHSPGNSESLAFPFFDSVIEQRYPVDPGNVPTDSAAPTLLPVDQSTGWLVDQEHAAWSTGYLEFRAADGYAEDPLLKGWMPSESMARLYRATASYDSSVPWNFAANSRKTVEPVLPYNPNNPVSDSEWQAVYHPDTATYPLTYEINIAPSHPDWVSLEVYDGTSLLTTVNNDGSFTNDTVTVTLPTLDSTRRLNGLYTELILPAGERRTSHITWVTADENRVRPSAPANLASDQVADGDSTVETNHSITWNPPPNSPVTQYGVVVDSGTETLQSGTSLALSALTTGLHEIKVRAQGTNGLWGPYALLSFEILDPVQTPDSLIASAVNESSASLSWNDNAPNASGYDVQRRSLDAAAVTILDNGDADYSITGTWTAASDGTGFYGDDFLHDSTATKGGSSITVTPGLTGSYEISAWVTPTQNADNRVPVHIQHAGGTDTLRLNQSTIVPSNEWDFRDADDGVNINHSSVVNTGNQFDPGTSQSEWSWSTPLQSSLTSGGNLRLNPSAGSGASTFSGYSTSSNNLDYSSGTWVLEVDLAGWNVVGTNNDQWFQVSFMDNNGSTLTCGLVLQQNASGLALWGRALGSGSPIGGVTSPIKQFPATQSSPVTLRLEADFNNNTYRVFYRDNSTNGGFVEAGSSGTIDSAREGRALRLQMVQDWSQSGEFIDLTRIRTYALPATTGEGDWSVLGTYTLDAGSSVSIDNTGTWGLVRADAVRFVPAGVGVWSTIANLPALSESYSDSGLTPGGNYEYRVRAVAGAVTGEWSAVASLTLPASASYNTWAAGIDWDGADNAPHADANEDGFSNFLTYALGGDPLAAGPQATLKPTLQSVGNAVTPVFEYTFYRARAELTYRVRTSETLAEDSWSTLETNPGSPGEFVSVAIPPELHDKVFVHLEVE